MNNRLTLAALSLVVAVLSFNCGSMTKADAGTGGGTGGGTGAGGGGGGGVTGGGGGGVRTCDMAPVFLPADIYAKGFDPGTTMFPPYNFATFVHPSTTAGRIDGMQNELFVDAPVNNAVIPAKNYAMCDFCYYMQLGCNNMGAQCTKSYLAQGGRLTVTAATKDVDAGTYAFTLTDVTYEEWDFTTDTAVDGGCLTLPSFSYTATWP